MNTLKFRIAAKTDVGVVRQNNEDNFQVSSDLNTYPMRWVNNEICSLGNKGALLVVADGMGGMNAGEVASEIAIETVKEFFTPENITDEVVKNRYSIEKFMNSAIEEADARIKKEAKSNPESRGMGTTIVIGWIFDNKLYVSWCGDSRAYVYNPAAGLHQISKDHSYVQNLVDKGAISKEDAFDYPESNIITRCLCDSSTKAKPESLLSPYDVCNGDIIMLCTDGLSGMLRDNEIETIIRNNEHDMDVCTDILIQAACDAEGSDNITICVAQILQGADACNPYIFDAFDKRLAGPAEKSKGRITVVPTLSTPNGKMKMLLIAAAAICLVAIIAACCWGFYSKGASSEQTAPADTAKVDTLKSKITLADRDGNGLTIECVNDTPKVGDVASPDGTYYMEDKKIITVQNGKIVSITIDESNQQEESVPDTDSHAKPADGKAVDGKTVGGKTVNGKLVGGKPNGGLGNKSLGPNTGGASPEDEEVLTPVPDNRDNGATHTDKKGGTKKQG